MKVTAKNIFTVLAFLFMFGYASYSNIIAKATNGLSRYILLVGILFFVVLANSSRKFTLKLPSSVPPYMLLWFLMGLFALAGIVRVRFGSLQIVICILFAFVAGTNDDWIETAVKIAKFLLFVFVFFTFFFLLFPKTYKVVTHFYGFIPDGTARGAFPYRAGIASHYSINALNISLLLIFVAVKYILDNGITLKFKKGSTFDLVLMGMTFFALLMTAKRGVLVWSILAVGIFYILLNKGNVGNIIKVIIIALILLGILILLSENIAVLSKVFERFRVVGTSEDNSAAQRLAMWKLALRYFKKSPIFGTGFWTYRGFYNTNLSAIYDKNGQHGSIDAHNVYIQVLCETGIIGLTIYLLAIGFLLYRTITLLWTLDRNESRLQGIISLSLALQIFYILYSFSGNCFYDMTFFYYSFSMALTYAAENRIRKNRMQYSRQSEEVQQNVREVYYDEEEVVETVRETYNENSNVNLS